MKWTMIQMSLKKHSLYNLNWSCFEHTVPCANVKPCCIVLQLHMYLFEKLSRNQSWVNLLFSVLQDSILDAILDSLFLIRTGIENRESSQESRLATDCQLTFEWYCISRLHVCEDNECMIWRLENYDQCTLSVCHLRAIISF